jgi:hypothetical protein
MQHSFTVLASREGFLLLTSVMLNVSNGLLSTSWKRKTPKPLSSPLSGSTGTMVFRRFSFRFLSRLCIYQLELLRQFKFTVLAFYDDEKPEHDPFEDFLAIPHQGQLANSPYTELDTATTLLYGYIPADVATMILSPSEKDRFARASFPSPEIAGIGVMNARCVTVEMI